MTEAEWRACADPEPMLEFLRDKAGDRKLRLFACACCRRVGPLLPDERSRRAMAVAERYADGLATERERARAGAEALGAADRRGRPAAWAAYWAASKRAAGSVWNVCAAAAEAAARAAAGAAADPSAAWSAARAAEAGRQAQLLRCVAGNPFRPAALDPAWLRWHGGTAVRIARAVYEERRFGDLPVLGDALEEAGCADAGVLAHCRGAGEHALGCWVVDLLLGKT